MTDFEVHTTIVKRFFGKYPMSSLNEQWNSDGNNMVEVAFPRRLILGFRFGGNIPNDEVHVYLCFNEGITPFYGENNLFSLVYDEFYDTEVTNCPFKEFMDRYCDEDCLKGVIRRDELTDDRLTEYVNYILHPDTFFKKLLKLADGNTEDYDDLIEDWCDEYCEEYYEEEDDDEQPSDSDDD